MRRNSMFADGQEKSPEEANEAAKEATKLSLEARYKFIDKCEAELLDTLNKLRPGLINSLNYFNDINVFDDQYRKMMAELHHFTSNVINSQCSATIYQITTRLAEIRYESKHATTGLRNGKYTDEFTSLFDSIVKLIPTASVQAKEAYALAAIENIKRAASGNQRRSCSIL